MRIVKCSRCGKYIHKADRCFHCGNIEGFDETDLPAIHENVTAEYSKVEFLVETKKFDEALSLSHTVIEWMPDFSGIFWLRLLAKNKCTSASELIEKGFPCEDDADFCNALVFSVGAEHSAYLDIQNMVRAAQKALKGEILNHEYNCKAKTNVLELKTELMGELDKRQQKLFSLWSDLEETEHALYALEMDCRLLSKEYRDALSKAAEASNWMKTETYRLEECTVEDLHRYQIRIGIILQESEQAKNAIENMKKQHPWVKSFNELVSKRDRQAQLITAELTSLRDYEATVQQTLAEIDEIEARHKRGIRAVENYNFQDAAAILGRDCYNQVFHSIGLGIDLQLPAPSGDWKPVSTANTSDDWRTDDDKNTDDYYNAWGLPIS